MKVIKMLGRAAKNEINVIKKYNKGYLRKLFFDVKMRKYVCKRGVMKEHSHSYETEEQRSLRAYFTFRPFRWKWSFTHKDSFRRYPICKYATTSSNDYFSSIETEVVEVPFL